jgi:hypothetical protein
VPALHKIAQNQIEVLEPRDKDLTGVKANLDLIYIEEYFGTSVN